MVSPDRVMEIIQIAIDRSGEMPSNISYLLREADQDNDDANIDLPLIQIQPTSSIRLTLSNTDFQGYVTDDAGNHLGRVYHAEFNMTFQIDCWTIDRLAVTSYELGEALESALYPYDSFGPDKKFEDEQGRIVDEIWNFEIRDGETANDLVQTPSVRRWRQEVEVSAFGEFSTNENYISTVNYPSSGDLNDTDGDGIISNT